MVCVASGIIAVNEYNIKNSINKWVIVFGFFALIYNPLIPFHLGRTVWTPVNIITIVCLGLHYLSYVKKYQSEKGMKTFKQSKKLIQKTH